MNVRDLPGPGDYERFPITSPNDPRYDDERGVEDAVAVIADSIFDASIVDAGWMSVATLRAIKADASKEARVRFDLMRREDEADAAAERMGH